MIRRHKDSTLNGKRLLDLPPKDTIIEELDFTMEERQVNFDGYTTQLAKIGFRSTGP
jgi:hypothetical protein